VVLLVGALARACLAAPAIPDPASSETGLNLADAIQQQVRAVFEKAREAVVRIEATDNQGELAGTGFFIEPDGILYTSYTVGGESHGIVVQRGDLKYPATRLIADARAGIAILKVDATTPFLTLGTSRGMGLGAPAMTVGYPMDLPLTPSFGIVGGFDRKYLGRYFAMTHIRANVPVQRGEGGAPLLNLNGEVVGILISSLDQGSALFALPIEAAEKMRRDYVRFGKLRPGWIGIDVGATAPSAAASTAMVRSVFENTPAAEAGVLPGDVLLQVGSIKISVAEDVLDASYFLTAQDEVKVRVSRGDEEMTFEVTPTEPPNGSTSLKAGGLPALGSSGDLKGVPPGSMPLGIGP
jgi:S1-C subfamily serine protease